MSRSRTHKDVEFAVDNPHGVETLFKTFDEAAGYAVALGVSTGEVKHIDVLIWSKAGARWYGGEAGVEQYNEEPEASVFERIVVQADAQGRVP